MSAGFDLWMKRTGGNESPNPDERFLMMRDRAEGGCSFAAEEVLWMIGYLTEGNNDGPRSRVRDQEPEDG